MTAAANIKTTRTPMTDRIVTAIVPGVLIPGMLISMFGEHADIVTPQSKAMVASVLAGPLAYLGIWAGDPADKAGKNPIQRGFLRRALIASALAVGTSGVFLATETNKEQAIKEFESRPLVTPEMMETVQAPRTLGQKYGCDQKVPGTIIPIEENGVKLRLVCR